jgi:hypothetical protein
MMQTASPREKILLGPGQMADRAGVRESWLRAEAAAGRIPSLRLGKALLFHPLLVERALLKLAESAAQQTPA